MTRYFLVLCIAMFYTPARAEDTSPGARATTSLAIVHPEGAQVIDIDISIDNASFDEHWNRAFVALFAFADVDGNGTLDEQELRFVPSARAVRLAIGNGFAPPVAPMASLKDVVEDASQGCSPATLKQYYRRNRVGSVRVGCGELKDASGLNAALLEALDEDKDATVSRAELLSAENRLRSFDVNDDELIGSGELLANCVYPGGAATNEVHEAAGANLSGRTDSKSVLVRLPVQSEGRAALLEACVERVRRKGASDAVESLAIARWTISVADRISNVQLCSGVGTRVRCEAWTVTGPLPELYQTVYDRVTGREPERPATNAPVAERRERVNPLGWLVSMVDRDRNGEVSEKEVEAWLEIQRMLTRGQVLLSVMYGGGLFEILDVNHDGALCPRELRNAWTVLESAACTSGEGVDLGQVPSVVMIIASQGYPDSFARPAASGTEWFRKMDRNSDEDISRREFTGSTEAFSKLDIDRDGLISPEEASRSEGR